MKTLPSTSLMALTLGLTLAACGSSDDPAPPPPPPPAPTAAVFLDAAVEGLDVVAGTAARATTDAKGAFSCAPGSKVAFSVGGVAFGSADCAAMLTPLSLAGVTDINDSKVVNRLLALQLLDDDNDPANGIRISSAVKTAMEGKTLDFNAAPAAFDAALAAHLNAAGPAYGARTINADRRMLVREHFEDTMSTKVGKLVTEAFNQATPLGTVSTTVTRYQIAAPATSFVPYEGSNASVKTDFPAGFLPSYGSGLAFKGLTATGDLEFYGLTDRGPNGDGPNVPALTGSGTMGWDPLESTCRHASLSIL